MDRCWPHRAEHWTIIFRLESNGEPRVVTLTEQSATDASTPISPWVDLFRYLLRCRRQRIDTSGSRDVSCSSPPSGGAIRRLFVLHHLVSRYGRTDYGRLRSSGVGKADAVERQVALRRRVAQTIIRVAPVLQSTTVRVGRL